MPRGPRRLTISFGASSLTHYGGRLCAASLLDTDRVQERARLGYSTRSAKQSLHYRRDDSGTALSDDPRAGANRNDPTAPTERRLSVPHWPAKLSRRYDAAALLAPGCPDGAAQAPRVA